MLAAAAGGGNVVLQSGRHLRPRRCRYHHPRHHRPGPRCLLLYCCPHCRLHPCHPCHSCCCYLHHQCRYHHPRHHPHCCRPHCLLLHCCPHCRLHPRHLLHCFPCCHLHPHRLLPTALVAVFVFVLVATTIAVIVVGCCRVPQKHVTRKDTVHHKLHHDA